MQRILTWMVTSTQFKKWDGIIGGFCLGLWVSARYWRQIRDSLAVWGIDRNEWLGFLVAIIGASGISASVALSMEKKRRETKAEQEDEPK